jgi:riboflavin synthase
MFTGLIEGIGDVVSLSRRGEDAVICVTPRFDMSDCRIGDSVAVDGVCLTVTLLRGGAVFMDVSGETLERTTLASVRQGAAVNLERALLPTDRLGGHLVSGHVDGIGVMRKKESRGRSFFIKFSVEENLAKYIIEKGSVAVDGISLTVNDCTRGSFDVNIIPQTGRETTLLGKAVGAAVNIETDIIGKYVERFLMWNSPASDPRAGKINMNMLKEEGFFK